MDTIAKRRQSMAFSTRATAGAERPSAFLPRALFWAAAIAIIGALLFLRRPDALLHPQLWAEDGVVWYANAYNQGAWRALLFVRDGYLQVFPRLVAAIAQWVPLARAPLLFNSIALFVEALPPLFLVSSRTRNLGPLWLRCLLALLYLFVPASSEVHANITNSQSQLVVLACLVLIAETPRSWLGCMFDALVLLLCGLTTAVVGPLLAVALALNVGPLLLRRGKDFSIFGAEMRWRWVQTLLLAAAASVQAFTLLTAGSQRLQSTLGATPGKFVRIVAGNIVLPVFLGRNRLFEVSGNPHTVTLVATLITIAAGLAFVYAMLRGTRELRGFVLLAGLVLLAALTFPNIQPVPQQWDLFVYPIAAARYWYIPRLALMATMIWLLGRQRPQASRTVAAVLTAIMVVGLVTHWSYPAFDDLNFSDHVRTFEQLPPGVVGRFPLNPHGLWIMRLVKK